MTTSMKTIIALLVTLPVFTTAFLSETHAQKAEFGVRFMPTVSSFDMKSYEGGTIKGEATWGYGVGGFLGLNLSEHVGAQVEVIYNSLSQQYQESGVDYRVNLYYVNIPLLLSLNTGKTKPVNFNIVAGPQLGISVGSDVKTSGGDGVYTTSAMLSLKKGDIGVAYGAGLDFGVNKAKTIRLGIGFRGVYGLVDISDNSETTTTESFYILDRTNIETYSAYAGVSILF